MGSPLSNSTGAQAGAPEPTGPQVDLFIDVAIYGLTSPDGPVGSGRGERRGIPYTYVCSQCGDRPDDTRVRSDLLTRTKPGKLPQST